MEENIQTPNTSPEVVQDKPKKKGKGCLIALGILLVILVVIAGVIYWGYKKVMGLGEQIDLNVTYTQQDFDNAWNKFGTEIDPAIACLDCPTLTYTDHKEVSTTFNESEASAVVDIINENLEYGSISNSQVSFNDDGTAELSTIFSFQGQTFPVYLSGTFGKQTDSSVFGSVSTVKAGGISLPSNITDIVGSALVEIANTRIQDAGVRIDTLDITGSGLEFDGLVPTQAQ